MGTPSEASAVKWQRSALGAPALPEPDRSPAAQALVVAALLVGLVAPLIAQMAGVDPHDSRREFRRPADRPVLPNSLAQLDTFPARFDLWYQDAFGLRPRMIEGFNRAMVQGLGESPTDKLLLGKDGWIFHRESGAVEMYRGIEPFDEVELAEWGAALQQRSDWASSRGSTFVYVPLPAKFEVYPEMVPDRFTRLGPSRRDQILDYLCENTTVFALDVLPSLIEAKKHDRPGAHSYFPYGVHWTHVGAVDASAWIIEQLIGEGLSAGEPVRFEDYEVVPYGRSVDTWAGRLYLEGHFPMTESRLKPRQKRAAKEGELPKARSRSDTRYRHPNTSLPSIAVYHDSNGRWILPFLAESFSVTYGLRHVYFEPLLMETLRPDIVLQLQTERILYDRVPMLQAHLDDGSYRTAFDASDDVRLVVGKRSDVRLVADEDSDAKVEITRRGVVRLSVGLGSHRLELPRYEVPGTDQLLLLRIDMRASAASVLDVHFKRVGQRDFMTTQTYPVETKRGRHEYFVPLSYTGATGEIALHVAREPASVVIHGIEIRSVPRPKWRPKDSLTRTLGRSTPSSK